ncbi:MAG: T9SS type A sorting domain-containing protein, partial [Candidatus Latescibacteria bacterium]|nr:T9SS type A sorting domain-containing protein [Candidatus Latescibacterota bacterium]
GPTGLSVSPTDLYISDSGNNRIVVKPLNGDPAHVMVLNSLPAPPLANPLGLTVAGTDLYVADAGNNRIVRAPLNESSTASVLAINGVNLAGFVPADVFPAGEGDELVIADAGVGRLVLAPFDASNAEELDLSEDLTTGLQSPTGLTANQDVVFIADAGTDPDRVVRILIFDDGGLPPTSILDVTGVSDLAIDSNEDARLTGLLAGSDGPLVIVDSGNNRILAVDQEGGTAQLVGLEIASVPVVLNDPRGIAVTEDRLFIADRGNDRILSSDTNSGEPPFVTEELVVNISPALAAPEGLAADDNTLYISDGLNRIVRVGISSGPSNPLPGEADLLPITGLQQGLGDARGLSLSDTHLYIADTNNDRVVRVPLGGGDAEVVPVNDVGGLLNPTAVLTLGDEELIITDSGNDRIVVVNFDPPESEAHSFATLIPGGFSGPAGLAAGLNALFVADSENNRIVRIDIENDGDGDGQSDQFEENLIVTDGGNNQVIRIYEDGYRQVLSDNGTGGGPSFIQLRDISIEPSGSYLVTDSGYPGVLRVDRDSGDRSMVSDESGNFGAGVPLTNIDRITIGNDGAIYVTVGFDHPGFDPFPALLRIDPNSGDRNILSGLDESGLEIGSGGVGTFFGDPSDIDFNKLTGHIFVTDLFGSSVFSVDPFDPTPESPSGNRVLQVHNSQGTGTALVEPVALALWENNVLMLDTDSSHDNGAVLVADLNSNGDRSVFSSDGQGHDFVNAVDVVAGFNRGFVADAGHQAIVEIEGGDPGQNPNWGQRTIYSRFNEVGDGPGFNQLSGMVLESIEIFNGIMLTTNEVFADQGDIARIPIKLENPTDQYIGGLQGTLRIDNPSLATVVGVEDTLSIPGFSVSVALTDSSIHFVVFSVSGDSIAPTDGEDGICIATLLVHMEDGNLNEETQLSFSSIVVGNAQGEQQAVGVRNGRVQYKYSGDMNLDDDINVLDAVILVRGILDDSIGYTMRTLADHNSDNEVNVEDVVSVVNEILDILVETPGKPVASGPVAVNMGELVTLEDGQTAIPIHLNTSGLIAGAQAEFTYDPAGLEIGTPQFGGATGGMAFDYRIEDGKMRVIVYSLLADQGLGVGDVPMMLIPVTPLVDGTQLSLTQLIVVERNAGTALVNFGVVTQSLAKSADLPTTFALTGNRPNPFNPSTTIAYEVPRQAHMTLTVYNILGQEVIRLVDEVKPAGRYSVVWNGTNVRGQGVASGVYMYRLSSSTGFRDAQRMILLK